MPILHRRASATNQWRRARASMEHWANLFCNTTQFVTLRSLMPCCSIFQLQPTQPRWRLALASGTAWRWNLPLLFLGSASAVMLRDPQPRMLEAAQSVGAMRVASSAAYAETPIGA